MTIKKLNTYLIILLVTITIFGCNSEEKKRENVNSEKLISSDENSKMFLKTIQKHLDAVSNRDLIALESTLSPEGNMQFILPSTETTHTVKEFMDYHKEWFAIPDWTFETKILNSEVSETLGMVITEVIYREPERNGQPYFNRMIVSYDLKKLNGRWYVIKDHASSVEKSTD